MFDCQLVIRRWNGPQVKGKVREANRRLVGSIAYDAQNEAKNLAHVRSGRMRGATTVISVNSGFSVAGDAPPMDHGKDREGAIAEVTTQIGGAGGGERAVVRFGSFVPYSFVEEVLRGHRFIHPGLDIARGHIPARIAQVGKEVGLR